MSPIFVWRDVSFDGYGLDSFDHSSSEKAATLAEDIGFEFPITPCIISWCPYLSANGQSFVIYAKHDDYTCWLGEEVLEQIP